MEEIKSHKILVVDDEDSIREMMCDILLDLGMEPSAASSGQEAIRHIAAGQFDLVLLDITMPGLTGIETLRAMRERVPGQAVIMLTAVTDLQTAVKAMQLGALDYVLKPVSVQQLTAKMSAAIERSAQIREELTKATRLEELALESERLLAQRAREIQALNRLFHRAMGESESIV